MERDRWRRLTTRAAAQYGLLAADDLRASGVRPHARDNLIRSGRVERHRPGIYRVVGSAPSWEQEVMAACLATGTPGAASHRTAARLWELEGFGDEAVETIVLRGLRRPRWPGVEVHRTRCVDLADLGRHRRGIPVVSVGLCLHQLAGSVHAARVEQAADDALRRRLVTVRDVRSVIERYRGRGRAGVPVLEDIVAFRERAGRPLGSRPEQELVRLLRRHGLPEPVAQYEVVLDGHRHFVDLAYPEARLAIEYDGEGHHFTRRAFHADPLRRNRFEAAGWTYLVVTSRGMRAPNDLLRQVRRVLTERGRTAASSCWGPPPAPGAGLGTQDGITPPRAARR